MSISLLRLVYSSLMFVSISVFTLLSQSAYAQVCDRTDAIEVLLLAELNLSCNAVTGTELAALTGALDWSNSNVSNILGSDLDGLSGITAVDLSDNTLQMIVNGTFNQTAATVISLANNNISVIQAEGLRSTNAPNVSVDIDLSNNLINSSTFDSSFLTGLTSASNPGSFDFSHNNITTLASTYFNIVPNVLNLSNNQISNFPANTFAGFSSSADITIDLSNNQISNVAAQSFPTGTWHRLDLSHNQISSVGTPAFIVTTTNGVLNLSHNDLTTFLPGFLSISSGASLDLIVLDNNNITLAGQNFLGMGISRIFLRNGNLTSVPANTFFGVPGLETINLSNNSITSLDPGALASTLTLKSLHLAHNNLTTINAGYFRQDLNYNSPLQNNSLSTIENLYLQGNQIATVPDDVFLTMANLTLLNLSDNDLTQLSADMFNGLRAQDIDLSNNNIAALPVNLLQEHYDPSAIVSFDIAANPVEAAGWEITNSYWQDFGLQQNILVLNIDHPLPVDITVPISSSTGTFDVAAVTILANQTASNDAIFSPTIAGATPHVVPDITQISVASLSGYINVASFGFIGICDRTQEIQDVLLTLVAENDCSEVTLPQLQGLSGVLDMTNEQIAEIALGDLHNLTAIDGVDFSDNTINTLVNGTFEHNSVNTLSFANNNLTTIHQQALHHAGTPSTSLNYDFSHNSISNNTLASLFLKDLTITDSADTQLNLSNNNITALQQSYLDSFFSRVDLSNNQIGDFPADTFSSLQSQSQAVTLALHNNAITELLANTFNGLGWSDINLSNNQVSTLAANTFSNAANLQRLDLSHNQISDFNASAIAQGSTPKALTLWLDNNAINLKANNFNGLVLDQLFLRNAQLTTIPLNTFAGVSELAKLTLTNNSIATIDNNAFATGSQLTELYLDSNAFATVPTNLFTVINQLETLDLSDNQISTVSAADFAQLVNLDKLNLSNNSIASLDATALQNLTATVIDLSNNNITALPVNLLINHANPANITSFNLTGNSVNSWKITNVSWIEQSTDVYALQLGHPVPVDINISIVSDTGTLNASEIVITKGSTLSSQTVSWTGFTAQDTITVIPISNQQHIASLSGYIEVSPLGSNVGICDRTLAIRTLLLELVPVSECAAVDVAMLLSISGDVDWNNVSITEIGSNDLDFLTAVNSINLANNTVTSLANNTLRVTAFDAISLAGNNIATIGRTALFSNQVSDDDINVNLSANALTDATLSSGFLTALDNNKFVGGSFDLSFNQITDLQQSWLTGFNPRVVHWNDNQIATIQANGFSSMVGLQQLYLQNNNLSSITADIFANLTSVVELNLNHNQISAIGPAAFAPLTALQSLALGGNNLTNLTADMFTNTTAKVINLSNNNLASLPNDLLISHADPTTITSFDLTGNPATQWQIMQAHWEFINNQTVQLQLSHPLPTTVGVLLTSTTGTLSPSFIVIQSGSLNSAAVTWTANDANSNLHISTPNNDITVSPLSGYITVPDITTELAFNADSSNITAFTNIAIPVTQLPAASGGTGALTYSLVETGTTGLPGNLVFDATNRSLSGSVAEVGDYDLIYTVVDTALNSVNQAFVLSVVDNSVPVFTDASNISYNFQQTDPVNITLPSAQAGDGQLNYVLNDANDLPAGLVFDATALTITGSTNEIGAYAFIWQVTDSAGNDSAMLNISIEIEQVLSPSFNQTELFTNLSIRQDQPLVQIVLPSVSAGNGDLNYNFTTDATSGLPTGLVFNQSSLSVEGIPTEFGVFNITVTVSDSDLKVINDSDSFSFQLEIIESLGFGAPVPSQLNWMVLMDLTEVLPAAVGGVGEYTYNLAGSLPSGLSFDALTHSITGTAVASGNYPVVYRVTDDDGYVIEQNITVSVVLADLEFSSLQGDIAVVVAQPINITLSGLQGGELETVTFSAMNLPTGITFDADTLQLTGGARQVGRFVVTYQAKDSSGVQVEQTFVITVTINQLLADDIAAHQAIIMAESTINSAKGRFNLLEKQRLNYLDDDGQESANFKVSKGNWVGVWLNYDSTTVSNRGTDFSWDGTVDSSQVGLDFSGSNYMIGIMQESVSSRTTFTDRSDDSFIYSGSSDLYGMQLISLYAAYFGKDFNVWTVQSQGDGVGVTSLDVLGDYSALHADLDYSMSAFGMTYKSNGLVSAGYESMVSAILEPSGQQSASHSSNEASQEKFIGRINFAKFIDQNNQDNNFIWQPSLVIAARTDSVANTTSSGIETTFAVTLQYYSMHLEFGNRVFDVDGFEQDSKWIQFHLRSGSLTGFDLEFSQKFGSSSSRAEELFGDKELTDLHINQDQHNELYSFAKLSYGWQTDSGHLRLYTEGDDSSPAGANQLGSVCCLMNPRTDIKWNRIGVSFNAQDNQYQWSSYISGAIMNRTFNGLLSDDSDVSKINFTAQINF